VRHGSKGREIHEKSIQSRKGHLAKRQDITLLTNGDAASVIKEEGKRGTILSAHQKGGCRRKQRGGKGGRRSSKGKGGLKGKENLSLKK